MASIGKTGPAFWNKKQQQTNTEPAATPAPGAGGFTFRAAQQQQTGGKTGLISTQPQSRLINGINPENLSAEDQSFLKNSYNKYYKQLWRSQDMTSMPEGQAISIARAYAENDLLARQGERMRINQEALTRITDSRTPSSQWGWGQNAANDVKLALNSLLGWVSPGDANPFAADTKNPLLTQQALTEEQKAILDQGYQRSTVSGPAFAETLNGADEIALYKAAYQQNKAITGDMIAAQNAAQQAVEAARAERHQSLTEQNLLNQERAGMQDLVSEWGEKMGTYRGYGSDIDIVDTMYRQRTALLEDEGVGLGTEEYDQLKKDAATVQIYQSGKDRSPQAQRKALAVIRKWMEEDIRGLPEWTQEEALTGDLYGQAMPLIEHVIGADGWTRLSKPEQEAVMQAAQLLKNPDQEEGQAAFQQRVADIAEQYNAANPWGFGGIEINRSPYQTEPDEQAWPVSEPLTQAQRNARMLADQERIEREERDAGDRTAGALNEQDLAWKKLQELSSSGALDKIENETLRENAYNAMYTLEMETKAGRVVDPAIMAVIQEAIDATQDPEKAATYGQREGVFAHAEENAPWIAQLKGLPGMAINEMTKYVMTEAQLLPHQMLLEQKNSEYYDLNSQLLSLEKGTPEYEEIAQRRAELKSEIDELKTHIGAIRGNSELQQMAADLGNYLNLGANPDYNGPTLTQDVGMALTTAEAPTDAFLGGLLDRAINGNLTITRGLMDIVKELVAEPLAGLVSPQFKRNIDVSSTSWVTDNPITQIADLIIGGHADDPDWRPAPWLEDLLTQVYPDYKPGETTWTGLMDEARQRADETAEYWAQRGKELGIPLDQDVMQGAIGTFLNKSLISGAENLGRMSYSMLSSHSNNIQHPKWTETAGGFGTIVNKTIDVMNTFGFNRMYGDLLAEEFNNIYATYGEDANIWHFLMALPTAGGSSIVEYYETRLGNGVQGFLTRGQRMGWIKNTAATMLQESYEENMQTFLHRAGTDLANWFSGEDLQYDISWDMLNARDTLFSLADSWDITVDTMWSTFGMELGMLPGAGSVRGHRVYREALEAYENGNASAQQEELAKKLIDAGAAVIVNDQMQLEDAENNSHDTFDQALTDPNAGMTPATYQVYGQNYAQAMPRAHMTDMQVRAAEQLRERGVPEEMIQRAVNGQLQPTEWAALRMLGVEQEQIDHANPAESVPGVDSQNDLFNQGLRNQPQGQGQYTEDVYSLAAEPKRGKAAQLTGSENRQETQEPAAQEETEKTQQAEKPVPPGPAAQPVPVAPVQMSPEQAQTANNLRMMGVDEELINRAVQGQIEPSERAALEMLGVAPEELTPRQAPQLPVPGTQEETRAQAEPERTQPRESPKNQGEEFGPRAEEETEYTEGQGEENLRRAAEEAAEEDIEFAPRAEEEEWRGPEPAPEGSETQVTEEPMPQGLTTAQQRAWRREQRRKQRREAQRRRWGRQGEQAEGEQNTPPRESPKNQGVEFGPQDEAVRRMGPEPAPEASFEEWFRADNIIQGEPVSRTEHEEAVLNDNPNQLAANESQSGELQAEERNDDRIEIREQPAPQPAREESKEDVRGEEGRIGPEEEGETITAEEPEAKRPPILSQADPGAMDNMRQAAEDFQRRRAEEQAKHQRATAGQAAAATDHTETSLDSTEQRNVGRNLSADDGEGEGARPAGQQTADRRPLAPDAQRVTLNEEDDTTGTKQPIAGDDGAQPQDTGTTAQQTQQQTQEEQEQTERRQRDAVTFAKKNGYKTSSDSGTGVVIRSWNSGRQMSEAQLAEIDTTNQLAKYLNVRAEYHDTIGTPGGQGANGYYWAKDPNGTRVIHIAQDAEHPFRTVIGHELTHMIATNNQAGFQRLWNYLEGLAQRTGLDLDQLQEDMIRRYQLKDGTNLLGRTMEEIRRAAREEVLANAAYDVIGDRYTISLMAAQDRNLLQRIGDWVSKIRQQIRNMLNQYADKTPQARMLRDTDGALAEFQRIFLEEARKQDELKPSKQAAASVGENSQATSRYQEAMRSATSRQEMNQATRALAGELLKDMKLEATKENVDRLLSAAMLKAASGQTISMSLAAAGVDATWANTPEQNRAFMALSKYIGQMMQEEDTAGYQGLFEEGETSSPNVRVVSPDEVPDTGRTADEERHPGLKRFSIKQAAEAGGTFIKTDVEGRPYAIVDANGNEITEYTVDMLKNTPMGTLVDAAEQAGTISKKQAQAQRKFYADMMTMICKYKDAAMVWELVGNEMFSSIKSNSDKQYGTTVDFGTICTKTQAIINNMSNVMLELGRGLTREEVIATYDQTAKAGLTVPCPVCYVFSRWMGVPSLLGRMAQYQDTFGKASEAEIQDYVYRIEQEYEPKRHKITKNGIRRMQTLNEAISEARGKLDDQVEKLEKKLEETNKTKDRAQANEIIRQLDEIEKELVKLEAFTWVTQVRCKTFNRKAVHVNGKVVLDPDYHPVPKEILLDLRKTGDFAENRLYEKSWKFRNSRGAGMGKSIIPYSGAGIGDVIYHAATSSSTDKTRKTKRANALLAKNVMSAAKAIDRARERMRAQNLIGGHRFQSTSDFRSEWGVDYLMSFLEMQAIGAQGQLYTKVIEAVDLFASAGIMVNLSIMGRGNGYSIINGEKVLTLNDFSSVTGIDFAKAEEMTKKYGNVQMILVGMNDDHIRLAMKDGRITMIIPWHSSGNTGITLQKLVGSNNEVLNESTDYSKYQNDKFKETRTKLQQDRWRVRVNILQRKYIKGISAADMEIVKSSKYLTDLYERFYVKGVDERSYHVKLNEDQAKQIFPHEYWDRSSTIETADVNGRRFVEYCEEMGITPRFEQFSKDQGYWKLLIDRRMYGLDGKYQEPQAISVENIKVSEMPMKVSAKYAVEKYGKEYANALQNTLDTIHAMQEAKKFPEKSVLEEQDEQEEQEEEPVIRYSMKDGDTQRDAEYMEAVESGDEAKQKEMVEQAAKDAGYTIEGWHGSEAAPFTVFKPGLRGEMWFASTETTAYNRSEMYHVYLKMNNAYEETDYVGSNSKFDPTKVTEEGRSRGHDGAVVHFRLDPKYVNMNLDSISKTVPASHKFGDMFMFLPHGEDRKNLAKPGETLVDFMKRGRDEDLYRWYTVYKPEQIKSAAPVVYDNQGKVIPLSERFNEEQPDIRYSLRETVQDMYHDAAYMRAVKNGNEARQEELVKQAAQNAGYDTENMAYHGSPSFGFTRFDLERGGKAIFVSYDEGIAGSYANGRERTDIGTSFRYNMENLVKTDDVTLAKLAEDYFAQGTETLRPTITPTEETEEDRKHYQEQYDFVLSKVQGEEREWLRAILDEHHRATDSRRNQIWLDTYKLMGTLNKETDPLYYVLHMALHNVMALDGQKYHVTGGGLSLAGRNWARGVLINAISNENQKHGAVYAMYTRPGRQMVVDAQGAMYNDIHPVWDKSGRRWLTDEIGAYAKEHGYDSVRINNVYDPGQDVRYGPQSGDIGIFYDESDVKSADRVVYDNQGKVIPLSERFNQEQPDIRYSLRDAASELEGPKENIIRYSEKEGRTPEQARDEFDLYTSLARTDDNSWNLIRQMLDMKQRATQNADGTVSRETGHWKKGLQKYAKSVGDSIMGYAKSDGFVQRKLRELYEAMDRDTDKGTHEWLSEALQMAQATAQEIYIGDQQENPLKEELKSFFAEVGALKLGPDELSELNHHLGGAMAFRNRAAGIVNLTSFQGGAGIEMVYEDLAKRFGLAEADNAGTQIAELNDLLLKAKETQGVPITDEEFEYINKVAMDLVASYILAGQSVAMTRTTERMDTEEQRQLVIKNQQLEQQLEQQNQELGSWQDKYDEARRAADYYAERGKASFEALSELKRQGVTAETMRAAQEGLNQANEDLKAAQQRIKETEKKLEAARAKRDEYRRQLNAAQRQQNRQNERSGMDQRAYERLQKQQQRMMDELAKQRESIRKARDQARKNEKRRKAIESIRKGNTTLRQMIAHPNKNSFVPQQHVRAVAEFVDALSRGDGRQTAKAGAALQRALKDAAASDDYNTSVTFDKELQDMLDESLRILETKTDGMEGEQRERMLRNMTDDEIELLDITVTGIVHQIRTADTLIGLAKQRQVFDAGTEWIQLLNKHQKDLSSKIGQLARKAVQEHMSPQRFLAQLAHHEQNIVQELSDELSQGQRDMNKLRMQATKLIQPLTEGANAKRFDQFTGKNAVWYDTGVRILDQKGQETDRTVRMTGAMRASLYMHWQSEENRDGMKAGVKNASKEDLYQLTMPDENLLKAGKVEDAYKRGYRAYLNAGQIHQILDEMTDYEKAWCEAWKTAEETIWRDAINRTSLTLNGFRIANTENYFPISRDPSYIGKELDTVVMDERLTSKGFLKARVKAHNPMLLLDIADVFRRQIDGVSQYAGLAVPIRDFMRVYNVNMPGYADSVKAALNRTQGVEASKYMEKMIRDLQGGNRTQSSFLDQLRGKYAGATLGMNMSVIIKQAASYPAAASVVSYQSLARAARYFLTPKAIDANLIDTWTSAHWERRSQNLRDLEANANRNNPAKRGLHKLGNGIQAMDVLTTKVLWKAAEFEVQNTRADLAVGTDEYYEEVGKLYDRILEETQPEYSTMQRPGILRHESQLLKSVTMFKTQSIQNFGILFDSISRLNDMRENLKENPNSEEARQAYQAAKTQVARAVSSQVMSAVVLSVMTMLGRMLLHKMRDYEDDKGDLTLESVGSRLMRDSVSSVAGMFVGGSELFDLIMGVAEGQSPFDIEAAGVSTINDLYQNTYSLLSAAQVLTDADMTPQQKMEKLQPKLWKFAGSVTQMYGFPLNNVRNLIDGIAANTKDFVVGKPFSFQESGISFIGAAQGRDTSNKSVAMYIGQALMEGNEVEATRLYNEQLRQGKSADSLNSAILTWQRENVPEIREAAEAIEAGDINTYNQKLNAATQKGVSMANAVKMAESERKKLTKKETAPAEKREYTYDEILAGLTTDSTESTYSKSVYTNGQMNSLLEDGNIDAAIQVRDAMLEGGKTQAQINSSLTSYWKERLQQAYNEGDMQTVREITSMLVRMGMKQSTVQGWTTQKSSLFGGSSTKKSTGFGSGTFGSSSKKTSKSTGFGSGTFGSSKKSSKSTKKTSTFGGGGLFGS